MPPHEKMYCIPKRKPVGSPHYAVAATKDQPWATAHLRHQNSSVPPKESAPKPSHKKDKTSTPTKGEDTRHINTTTMAVEDVDAITPLPPRKVRIDPVAGHSNVTKPARPTRKHTYSELFDLKDLAPGSQIRSPSGQMLSAEQAASREDRPKGIEERQEAIRRRVAEHQASQKALENQKAPGTQKALGNEVIVVGDAKGKQKREAERKKRSERWEKWRKEKAQKMKTTAKELDCCCQ